MEMSDKAENYREWISIEEASSWIEDSVEPIEETELVSLPESRGRILCQDLKAEFDNPPFDRAPVDGYACHAADTKGASKETPVTLKVTVEIDAGQFYDKEIRQGEAVRIMTGAAIPPGCDCCIRQEDTDYGEDVVQIYSEIKPHANYCDKGEDFQRGAEMFSQGEKIGYVEIANLAGMGLAQIPVYRKPRIVLLTTGDEVSEPGKPLKPGKIYNSNFYMMMARLADYGITPIMAKTLGDDAQEVADAIRRAADLGAEMIITTGGVSVGKKDILHETVGLLGAKKLFWRVNLKPGTPTIFFKYNNIPVVSLSGNPFGAITNLELLVRPALAKMMRDNTLRTCIKEGVMQDSFPKASKGRRLIRAIWQEGKVSLPSGLHSSGVLSSMRGCNCLVDITPGTERLQPGDRVQVWIL